MNILFPYPFPDISAGTEITMHLWAEMMRKQGHKVFLAHGYTEEPKTSHYYDGILSVPSVFDRNSKLLPAGFQRDLSLIDQFITHHRIDVIHTHTYPRTEAIAYWAARYPLVVNVHVPLCPNGMRYLWTDRCVCERSIGLACFTTGYLKKGCGHLGNGAPMGAPGFVRGMWEDFRLRREIQKAALVITNSGWMMDRLEKDGFAREQLRLLYPYEMAGTGDPENYDLRVSPPVILFVGRMVNFKGPDQLLLASKEVTLPHQVWFVGQGPEREPCEVLAKDLGIAERVRFWGEMQGDAIDAVRRQATVVVVPSLWPEPFGRVGPEAMMIRRPVVGYRVGGIPEWLTDQETGYTVEMGDTKALAGAITRIIRDEALAVRMGNAAMEHCRQWTPETHGEILAGIYGEAIGKGKKQ